METIHENGGHTDERETRQERWKEINDNQEIFEQGIDEYLNKLAIYHSDYKLQPGEFTINDIINKANGANIDRGRVTVDLHKRAEAGELGEKLERLDGSKQWVFWRRKPHHDSGS